MLGVHSPNHRINFYYIPKCACTFARQLWCELHNEDRIDRTVPADFHDILNQFPPASAQDRGYIVTRNPYDRAVSMYTNLVCGQYIPSIYGDVKLALSDLPITFFNFCTYLLDLKQNNWGASNHHLLPQTLPTEYSTSISPECFTNGHLVILRCAGVHSDLSDRENCNQYLINQYKESYYLLTGSRKYDAQFDNFLTLNRFKNLTPRLSQFDGDASQIEMVGWKEFPPIDSFLTPPIRALIAQIYSDDFELLGYPLTMASDSTPI